MKRQTIAFVVAAATLFATGVITASAQTTGGSLLEEVAYLLKDSYQCFIKRAGTSLTLHNHETGSSGIRIDIDREFVIMQANLGNLSLLSKADRKSAREMIFNLNTRLPLGTLLVDGCGEVVLKHHVSTYYAEPTEIAGVVSRFAKEAAQKRSALFS
ncbi:MAG: hypothetical protein J4G05_04830 [Chlorobi bacterium]|nr:hypothetical protein [Chlorobiota bacterium]